MSQTATQLDLHKLALDAIQNSTKFYLLDLGHLAEDQLGVSLMGKARTAYDFTAEVIGFNLMVASVLKGETPQHKTDEERAAFRATINSLESASTSVRKSADAIAEIVNGLSQEQMAETVKLPWGWEMSRVQLVGFCGSHVMYHCGQLNYIQSLLGDDKSHWFEEA